MIDIYLSMNIDMDMEVAKQKGGHCKVKVLLSKVNGDFFLPSQYLQMQQTPNPAAHDPDVVPPRSPHSELVMQVLPK